MTVLSVHSESWFVLFLIAAIGLGSPLFSFPGFLPRSSYTARKSGGRLFSLGAAVRFGLAAFLLSIPGFILLQVLVRLPGGRWISILAGPLLLAGLFWLAGCAVDKVPALLSFADAATPRKDRWRLAAFSGVMALYPALDATLASGPVLLAAAFFAGTGCGLLLMTGVMGAAVERMHREDVPSWMRGTPALLVVAGLVAMAWIGLFRFFS